MKHVILILLIATLHGVNAAADESATIEWKGIDPDEAVNSSVEKDKQVYFYNVGQKKWLGRGGNWGVEAALSDVGIPFLISKSTEWNCYYFQSMLKADGTDNGYLYPTNYCDNGNAGTDYQLYFLSGHDKTCGYNLTKYETTDGTNQYQVSYSNGAYYMVGQKIEGTTSGSSSPICIYKSSELSDATEGNDKWIMVSQSEREQKLIDLAAESKQTLEDTKTEPCTYLVKDNDFARNATDVGNWKDADGDPLTNGGAQDVPASSNTTQYYIGNGLGINDNQQKTYGGLWAAHIHGASGKITQTINDIATTGKYTIKAHIFTTAEVDTENSTETSTITTTPNLAVKLFATSGDKSVENQNIQLITRPTTEYDNYPSAYITAAKLVSEGTYELSIDIFVGEDADNKVLPLTFGVEVSDGDEKTWTCIDDIELQFKGGFNNKVILNEEFDNVAYMNTQNDTTAKSGQSTIFLHRTLYAGQWNSIVLPFSVSPTTINNVFGSKTLVSVLKGATEDTPQTIHFVKTEEGIKEGQLYLIKPERATPFEVENQISSSASDDIYLGAETTYYAIDGRYGSDTDYIANITGDNGSEIYGTNQLVTFKGTYTLQKNIIPVHSYYLKSDGLWYYNTSKPSHSKGFRGWLATSTKAETENQAKKIQVAINGVISMGETTGIGGVASDETDNASCVYDLTGKLVAKDTKSIESLPKGIYIASGKKVLVK